MSPKTTHRQAHTVYSHTQHCTGSLFLTLNGQTETETKNLSGKDVFQCLLINIILCDVQGIHLKPNDEATLESSWFSITWNHATQNKVVLSLL